MTIISSRANAQVKQIRALRTRKGRDEAGSFFIEGLQAVRAAVEHGAAIEALVVAPAALTHPQARALVEQRRRAGAACLEVTPEVFDTLATRATAHGLAAVVRQRWERLDRVEARAGDCWVALESVRYPGNLGSILRTLDAVGGAGALLLGDTADPFDPACVHASTGAIFSQRLVRADVRGLDAWRRRGVTVIGAAPGAGADYRAARYERPLVLAFGSERYGLSAELRALCDATVQIPMRGTSDSLNLAVAAGVLLYEALRQRDSAVRTAVL